MKPAASKTWTPSWRSWNSAFGRQFGEAWTRSQLAGILPMGGCRSCLRASPAASGRRILFGPNGCGRGRTSAARGPADPPPSGIGGRLLDHFLERARNDGIARVHLEVRDGNPADGDVPNCRFFSRRPAPQLLSCGKRHTIRRDYARSSFIVKFLSRFVNFAAHCALPTAGVTILMLCSTAARPLLVS